jgi:hypothetical protein
MTMVMKMMKKEREEDEFMGFVLFLKFFFIEKRFLTIKSKVEIKKKIEKESTNPIHRAKSTYLHTHILLIVPHH